MSDVTQILWQIEQGAPLATEQLLPLVYDELRQLAAAKLARESPGQTLQATALVHEAYLRLFAGAQVPRWSSRRHFFAAAAEAMRRILIDQARAKKSQKRGGHRQRRPLREQDLLFLGPPDWVLWLDEAVTRLATEDAAAAELVKLRFFAGLSVEEASRALEISRSSGYRLWTYARACLLAELGEHTDPLEDDGLEFEVGIDAADTPCAASAAADTEPASADLEVPRGMCPAILDEMTVHRSLIRLRRISAEIRMR